MRRPGRTRAASAAVTAILLALPLAGLGIFHVWSRTRVLAAGYQLGRLEAEHRQLQADRDRLKLEVATLRSPGRLERYARERLGMAPPAPGTVVAGTEGGKGVAGGVVDGAGHRPGPAEPVVHAAARDGRLALRSLPGARSP